MTPDINDKFTFVGLATKTELASPGKDIGAPSINLVDTSNWQEAGEQTAVIFGMDRVETNSQGEIERVAGTYTEWGGVLSGDTIGSLDLLAGDDQEYPAGSSTRVYMVITAAWANRIVAGILGALNQDSTLKANTVGTSQLQATAVTSEKIQSLAVTRAKLETVTRKLPITVVKRTQNGAATAYPAASDNGVFMSVIIPDDYVSGDPSVKISLSSTGSTGNLSLYRNVFILRPGVATNNVEANIIAPFAVDTGSFVYSFPVAAANIQAGDVIYLTLNRDGPGVSDTSSDNVDFNGAWLEYSGKA